MAQTSVKPVFNSRFETTNHSLPRQIKMWFRMKTSVLGFFDTGPGLKNLLTLFFIHYAGKPFFWLRTWLGNQHAAKQKIKSLIRR